MKIAIHHRVDSFSEKWISYCKENDIEYKLVDVFDSDLINNLKDCDTLLWHHHHGNYKDVMTAKRILFSLEQSGMKVFPNFNSGWHFDDKVAQKYLLESINAPLIPSYVFYDKQRAIEWAQKATYPKVFKLKGGAGASNVELVYGQKSAFKLIKTAFGGGFTQYNRVTALKDRVRKFKSRQASLTSVVKAIIRLVIVTDFAKKIGREKGYVYFQDFIPNNNCDVRVIVIGKRAFAIKRLVREGDFRASGSGYIEYSKDEIDLRCIEISFEVSDKLNAQCLSYDFVFDENDNPLIIEISYGFSVSAYEHCPGYWSRDLKWNSGKVEPCSWMIQDIIKKV